MTVVTVLTVVKIVTKVFTKNIVTCKIYQYKNLSNEEQNKFIKKIIKENVHKDLVTIYFCDTKKSFTKKKL